MNMAEQVFIRFVGCMPRGSVAKSCGRIIFHFVRVLLTDFQRVCMNFLPAIDEAPLSPHPLQLWLSIVLLIFAILRGKRGNLLL